MDRGEKLLKLTSIKKAQFYLSFFILYLDLLI
jgi:hypothetical protein